MSAWSMPATGGPRRALHRAGPLSLRCDLGGFAHRFGDPLLIRPLRLTIEHLREPGSVLVTGRGLRFAGLSCALPRVVLVVAVANTASHLHC